MKMDRKYWLNTVIVCFLMMIIIIQIPMHVYADEKRTVAIGTNAEYAPFEYLDSNGDLTGFDIDLMNAIAEEAGFEVMDKIVVYSMGNQKIEGYMKEYREEILSDVLASDIRFDEVKGYTKEWSINGESVTLGVEKQ